MFGNPLTNQDLLTLAQASAEQKSPGLNLPEKYILATPVSGYGFPAYRLFDAAYISTGIIDPNRLGTGATGAGNLYLADDGTWKAVGGGGATTLDGLTDVTISAPANAQVLAYNSTTSQWENQTPSGGGGGGDMNKSTYDVDNDGIVDSAETVKIIVRNSTGSTLTKGSVVYLSGATGNRPNAVLSQANTEATSSKTIGIVIANIANNSDGYVAVSGTLHDLDTSAFADGVAVWLSATTAGAYTSTIPAEPNHTVFIGYVARSHPTAGRLVILIQNGYELNELHGVLVTSEANNDLLVYESSTSLWKNKTFSAIFGGTPLVSVPTLAQVTTAGNTTTNAINTGLITTTTSAVGNMFVANGVNNTGLTLLNDSSGRSFLTLRGNLSATSNAGAYFTAEGYQEAWFNVVARSANAGNQYWRFGNIGTGTVNNVFAIQKLNDAATTITLTALAIASTTGNVGINTTTDAGYKLDVNGTARINTSLLVGTDLIINPSATSFVLDIPLSSNKNVRFKGNAPYSSGFVVSAWGNYINSSNLYWDGTSWRHEVAGYGAQLQAESQNGTVLLSTAGYGSAGSVASSLQTRLIILNNGNVGIGTTTPGTNGATFEINAPRSSATTNPAQFRVSDGTTGGYFEICEGATGAAFYSPVFRGSSAGINGLGFTVSGMMPSVHDVKVANLAAILLEGAKNNYTPLSNANILAVTNYGTTLLNIAANGNVGINTTTDAGYRLDVNGTMRIQGATFDFINTAAVFKLGYNTTKYTTFEAFSDGATRVAVNGVTKFFIGASTLSGIEIPHLYSIAFVNPGTATYSHINWSLANSQFELKNGTQTAFVDIAANTIKSSTGVFQPLTTTTITVDSYTLSRAVSTFGLNTIGNALVVNDIDGAKWILLTGGYDLTFAKHISSTGIYRSSLVLEGDGATNDPQGFTAYTGTTAKLKLMPSGNLLIQNGGTFTDAGFKLDVNGTARVSGNLTVDTNTLFVDATNDRVGIGTTSPGYKLEISGTTRSDKFLVIDTGNNSVFRIGASTGSEGGLYLRSGAASDGEIAGGVYFVNGFAYAAATGASAINFYAGDTYFTGNNGLTVGASFVPSARMLLKANGNFLINTTTDIGYKLHVNGTVRIASDTIVAGKMAVGASASIIAPSLYVYGAKGAFGTFSDTVAGFKATGNTYISVDSDSGNDTGIQYISNGVTNWVVYNSRALTGFAYYSTSTSSTVALIKDNGNFLIGTTTDAGYKLNVNGTVFSTRFELPVGSDVASGDKGIRVQDAFGNMYQFNNSGPYVGHFTEYLVRNTSTTPMFYATATAFGIGTQSPSARVHILGGSANWNETTPGTSTGTIHLDPDNSTNNFGNAITFGASDWDSGNNAQAGIYVRSDDSYGTKMYFATTDSYVSGSKTRMFIGHDGNVGIGTTSPSAKLHVSGTIKATLASATTSNVVYYDSSTGLMTYGAAPSGGGGGTLDTVTTAGNTTTNSISVGGLTVANGAAPIAVFNSSNGGGTYVGIQYSGSLKAAWGMGGNIIGGLSINDVGFWSSNAMAWEAGGARRMTLFASGNLGINTVSDNGNKLQVNGTIDGLGFAVNGVSGWSGIITFPTNPPGQQNIDVQGGIIMNVF